MNSVEKIIELINSNSYSKKNIEEIIIEEIKLDRDLIVSEISNRHSYGFDDVSDDVNIELRKNWNTANMWQ